MATFKDKTAIAGYGATEFSKKSGRSELQLSVEAILAALADAGVDPSDVDGLATYTIDNNSEFEIFRNIGGRELKFFSRIGGGGGAACAPLQQAALAITAGIAKVVVCYRAMNERSEYRFGTPLQAALPTTGRDRALQGGREKAPTSRGPARELRRRRGWRGAPRRRRPLR